MAELILNPFVGDGFSVAELTKQIQIIPNNYGRVIQSGLFPARGVVNRSVIVEEENGVLNLLPTLPPGSPGTPDKRGKRTLRSFTIPHIPLDAELLPEEYAGVRAFGSGQQLDTAAAALARKLARMKAKHSITLEHLQITALQGVILDSDATTLISYYTAFNISQTTVDFVLGTTTTDVEKKCRVVVRAVEAALKGEVMTAVKAYVDASFFDKLIAHTNVRQTYINWTAAQNLRSGQSVGNAENGTGFLRQFPFGGMIFEEYQGTATDGAGTARAFLPTDTGAAFPLGTMDTFETLYAPADFLETANTVGESMYAKQEPRKFNRGLDIHTQQNPLPICYRPGVLVKLTTSN